jgi:F-type H+-transporting ATPase subunit b
MAETADPHAAAAPGADAAHAAAAHGGEHAASFPPFDIALFSSQVIWFALTFGALYLIMSRVALPRVAAVLEKRAATAKADLDAAAVASEEAEAARESAEKGAAAARTKARDMIEAMRAETLAEFAKEQAKVEAALAEKGVIAEKRIAETRAKAMADVGPIAAELSRDIAARVTGGSVAA